ncbi:MoaD/ThiS family protein [Tsuneonella troitsensis]|uniref:MoaD/ThiS family protein n=1 Tax=Tsuneonella troitsensis TaxID=292222 RepID=UPI000710270C|nr:MoaD/ThiS family protein [Tsuneonella troitsensis]
MKLALTVFLFGKLGDSMGRELSFDGELVGRTIGALRLALASQYPVASADLLSPRVRACVNDAIVDDGHLLCPGDEVSLLPPVSGG